MLYGNENLTGHERVLEPNEIIVTKTDLAGKITYANTIFIKYAGYTEKELLGAQHNIVRHPCVPRCIFFILWEELQQGREVFAFVDNRSKNGDNYWVFAHATPSFDVQGHIVGYHSNRRAPDMKIVRGMIMPLYAELLELEKSIESPKKAMQASYDKVYEILKAKNMTINEFIFSLGVK